MDIDEEGVRFVSHIDGVTELVLRPEDSIAMQNALGSDIMMQLDDVVSSLTTGPRVEEAMWRSIRWLDRCLDAHQRQEDQNLEMVARNCPGYAIGGLSGGESKDQFWRMVTLCTDILPEDKPRYCMGVGYAEDLVVCVALGVDMFDCVFPTRTARFEILLQSKTVADAQHVAIIAVLISITCLQSAKPARAIWSAYTIWHFKLS